MKMNITSNWNFYCEAKSFAYFTFAFRKEGGLLV